MQFTFQKSKETSIKTLTKIQWTAMMIDVLDRSLECILNKRHCLAGSAKAKPNSSTHRGGETK